MKETRGRCCCTKKIHSPFQSLLHRSSPYSSQAIREEHTWMGSDTTVLLPSKLWSS